MKTSTSFAPGERLTGRQKGSLNKRTKLKKEIGIENWEQIESYLITEGAGKLIDSMRQLKPSQYVHAYIGLLEFFKPKLSRQTINTGKEGEEKEIEITLNLGM